MKEKETSILKTRFPENNINKENKDHVSTNEKY